MFATIRTYWLIVVLMSSSLANCMLSRGSYVAWGLGGYMLYRSFSHTADIYTLQLDVKRLEKRLKKSDEQIHALKLANIEQQRAIAGVYTDISGALSGKK